MSHSLCGYWRLTIPTNEPLLKARQWRKLVTVENKFESRREETDMTEFLRKTRVSGVVENVAEYVVMLFVAAMTGLSTLRLLGILP